MTNKIEVNYHITDQNITITYLGKIRTINRNTEIGDEVMELIRIDKTEELPELLDLAIRLQTQAPAKAFDVVDGEVLCHGIHLPEVLSKKIIKFMDEKLPIQIFLKFWDNLNLNPSERAKKELFAFLEANHFPLTPDGCFIAYKSVKPTFKDSHSGTYDNSPGKIIRMDRGKVTDNPNLACGSGLHVASYTYAKHTYGSSTDILLEVKVNPANVVSIPTDHKNAKCRVCEYTVIGLIKEEYQVEVVPKKAPTSKKSIKVAKKVAVAVIDDTVAVLPTHLERIQIGPYAYKGKLVDKVTYDLHSGAHAYSRVKPSKYPEVLNQIKATEVFRKLITNTKYDYYLMVDGLYLNYFQVNK